jgi:hypothetical protein
MSDFLDPDDQPIYGVPSIARAIKRSESQTYYSLERGFLPAGKLGKIWFTTPRRIRAFLNGKSEVAA